MQAATFTNGDHWCGSYYELSILIGPTGDDVRLAAVLDALWFSAALQGPWQEVASFGETSIQPSTVDQWSPLYGTAELVPGGEVGCVSHVVREEEGDDWVCLCFPTGMLHLLFPVQYPLVRETNPWRQQVDRFFVELGKAVFSSAPFSLAVIGEEVSGTECPATVCLDNVCETILLLPDDLMGRLRPDAVPAAGTEAGLTVVGSS